MKVCSFFQLFKFCEPSSHRKGNKRPERYLSDAQEPYVGLATRFCIFPVWRGHNARKRSWSSEVTCMTRQRFTLREHTYYWIEILIDVLINKARTFPQFKREDMTRIFSTPHLHSRAYLVSPSWHMFLKISWNRSWTRTYTHVIGKRLPVSGHIK